MSDEQEDTTYTLLSDEDRSKVKQRLLAAHEHLFHGTPAADLDRIRQNGLHPRFESVHSAYANMADDPFTTSLISKMPFWRRKAVPAILAGRPRRVSAVDLILAEHSRYAASQSSMRAWQRDYHEAADADELTSACIFYGSSLEF